MPESAADLVGRVLSGAVESFGKRLVTARPLEDPLEVFSFRTGAELSPADPHLEASDFELGDDRAVVAQRPCVVGVIRLTGHESEQG
jgi:hypothetical protein